MSDIASVSTGRDAPKLGMCAADSVAKHSMCGVTHCVLQQAAGVKQELCKCQLETALASRLQEAVTRRGKKGEPTWALLRACAYCCFALVLSMLQ